VGEVFFLTRPSKSLIKNHKNKYYKQANIKNIQYKVEFSSLKEVV